MQFILLSGGSGKRLWPLSNEVRSKQFIQIFQQPEELGRERESMVQRVYRGLTKLAIPAGITVATSESQVSAIRNQLVENVGISVEPCRRDTFPAIALASAFLHNIKGVTEEEAVVVCPVDPYVEDDFFMALADLGRQAENGTANLTLLGIQPTYPSEKYGYIIPENCEELSTVKTFREKPDEETARKYISQGALWNGGVFAYKLGYMLSKARELLGSSDYDTLLDGYMDFPKISIDYAVAEKEPSIQVRRFAGTWKDLGTWNTLTEAMDKAVLGKGRLDATSSNTHIVNELDVPVIGLGLHDVVVAVSPEGVLVSDKQQSGSLKPMVEAIHQEIRIADKSWGSYRVLDVGNESLTIKVTLKPGHSMHYQRHKYRDEVWTIVSGQGYVIIDGVKQKVAAGETIRILRGMKHLLAATTEVKAIEVQTGMLISAEDKEIFDEELTGQVGVKS